MTVDRMRAESVEAPSVDIKIRLQVRQYRLWAGVFLLSSTPGEPGVQVLTVRAKRPEGKTDEACVKRLLHLLAAESAEIANPAATPEEEW